MRAFEVFAIYVMPFLLLGLAIKFMMKRHGIELSDVQEQAGPNRRPREIFLLGSWRTEK